MITKIKGYINTKVEARVLQKKIRTMHEAVDMLTNNVDILGLKDIDALLLQIKQLVSARKGE